MLNDPARPSGHPAPNGAGMSTDIRMVAVFRTDLRLSALKMASQAGHAYLMTFLQAQAAGHPLASEYAKGSQAKISLAAPDLATLQKILERAQKRGVPAFLVTDEGRTELGKPTVTVLGLGPMTKTDSNALTRGLEMKVPWERDDAPTAA